jgi:hypothetical protein
MNTRDIVLGIDAEIAQLQKVEVLLTGTDLTTKRKAGRPAAPNKATSFNPVEFCEDSEATHHERRRPCKDRRSTKGSLGKIQESGEKSCTQSCFNTR